ALTDRVWIERNIAQRHDAAALADGTPAHGWNHGQLITVLEGIVPAGVLGVDRAAEGARQRAEIVAGAELAPGISGGRARRKSQIDVGLPHQFARLGKQHDAHVHGEIISAPTARRERASAVTETG